MYIKLFFLLASYFASEASSMTITVQTSHVKGGEVSPLHPGVTLDWWTRNDTRYGFQWGNASIFTIDFNNPNLIAAGQALAPGLLRLGGSPIDSIPFDWDGTCQVGGNGPNPPYYCSQVRPYVYGCLTRQRILDILAFGRATGLHLTLGINACWGRMGHDKPLDFSNAAQLLKYLAGLDAAVIAPLKGFEFGNELLDDPKKPAVDPRVYAADTNQLASLVHQIWSQSKNKARVPFIIGPASTFNNNAYPYMLSIQSGVLKAFTYHQYPQCLPPADGQFALDPLCLSQLDTQALMASSVVEGLNPNHDRPVYAWYGEGADHTAGGMDSQLWLGQFRSSFYYAWQISALPLARVPVSARQCLAGGNYGVLNHTTMAPQPDFWMAYMYRTLFGKILGPDNGRIFYRYVNMDISELASGLKAFCAETEKRAKTAFVLINLASNPRSVLLSGNGTTGSKRTEWHFHTKDGNVDTSVLYLNNVLLKFSASSNAGVSVPDLVPLGRASPNHAISPVVVQARTIAFVVIE